MKSTISAILLTAILITVFTAWFFVACTDKGDSLKDAVEESLSKENEEAANEAVEDEDWVEVCVLIKQDAAKCSDLIIKDSEVCEDVAYGQCVYDCYNSMSSCEDFLQCLQQSGSACSDYAQSASGDDDTTTTTTTTIVTTTSTTTTTGNPDDEEVSVPEGAFQMGCEPEDGSCDANESPRHEVWLSAYYIDTYEVTNESYAEFLTANGNDCDGYECVDADSPDLRLSESGGVWSADAGFEDHPLVMVSWFGAKAYCEVQGKRLPTEAEWEKAAKGAAEHYIYPWGDTMITNAANYRDSGDPYDNDTTPVGYFDGSDHGGAYQTTDGRSPYGAHDMAGNVWEWVNDWYSSTYYSTSPSTDLPGPASGMYRVLRGGCRSYGSMYLRASDRGWGVPFNTYHNPGFRCSRD